MTKVKGVTKPALVALYENVPCRIYNSEITGPAMQDTAARVMRQNKLSCALDVDIKAGDELLVVRGGVLGSNRESVRYFAGEPQYFYDPVGGALTGLQHQEVGLLENNIAG
jgi:hypothetical protein